MECSLSRSLRPYLEIQPWLLLIDRRLRQYLPPRYRPTFYFCAINLTVTPQEYIYCWEEFDVHLFPSNPTRLVSNGHRFIEVPFYPQDTPIHAGPTPPGPVLVPYVPPQLNFVLEQVDSLGRSAGLQEVAPNVPLPHFLPPSQPPPQPPRVPPRAPRPRHRPQRSSAPHIAQAASPLSPIPPIAATRMSTPSLSDDEARQILETWINNSDWFHQDEMEPLVGDPGVPACALQLALKGQSIYCCFLVPVLDRKGKASGWKSATDPASKPDRHQRAIGRERFNRTHFPFKCPRDLDHDPDHDPNWFVLFTCH